MKTERRHELQTNTLADHLGKTLEVVRPYLKWTVGGLVAGLVVVLVIGFVAQRRQQTLAAAWEDYMDAMARPERGAALQDVAAVYPGTPAGEAARLSKADLDLAQGTRLMFQNREEAEKAINAAMEGYQAVLKNTQDSFFRQRAQFGLGQANEALGRLNDAREAYEQSVRLGGPLAELAQRRLDDLKREDVQQFYDWFVAQKTLPSASDLPNMPSDLGEMPDFPNLSIPGVTPPPGTGSGAPGSDAASPPGGTRPPETAPPPHTPSSSEPPSSGAEPTTPAPSDKPPTDGDAARSPDDSADSKPAESSAVPDKPAEQP